MCQFLSAIITRDGKILHHWATDHHEDLIAYFNLREGWTHQNFIRTEFVPKDGKFDEVDEYTLRVDESSTPAWFDADRNADAEKYFRGVIERMIIRDERALLIDRAWILSGKARIKDAKGGARILAVYDSASVDYVYDSARIGSVYDSASIGSVSGSASIGSVYDSASVDYVYGSASVDSVSDLARIGSVYGSARIGSVSDSASIGSVSDSASIGSVSDSASVDSVSDSASIGSVYDSASVDYDNRSDAQKKANPLPRKAAKE